mmetsp:Transcript_66929/g.217760  ORF Transcript_66929/g.217760 Transcript_66929/m.217760 type:complete len:214 (-) Transcript_66929:2481-3122(-)
MQALRHKAKPSDRSRSTPRCWRHGSDASPCSEDAQPSAQGLLQPQNSHANSSASQASPVSPAPAAASATTATAVAAAESEAADLALLSAGPGVVACCGGHSDTRPRRNFVSCRLSSEMPEWSVSKVSLERAPSACSSACNSSTNHLGGRTLLLSWLAGMPARSSPNNVRNCERRSNAEIKSPWFSCEPCRPPSRADAKSAAKRAPSASSSWKR